VTGPKGGQRRLGHEARVLLLTLAAGLPAVAVCFALLFTGEHSMRLRVTVGALVVLLWLSFAFAARAAVARPLQTLSNLMAALREEDFSFRARAPRRDDALGGVVAEVNALATTLREQRLGALEATALLRKVMAEIEVAVFTFDADDRLSLVNRAGESLLGRPSEQLLGRSAEELGLAPALSGESPAVLDLSFPGGGGRWESRHGSFREGGRRHRLLVLANLSRALRDEERLAWQRLIRVLGHELNNSLAPIRSIAESLEALLTRPERPSDWEDDMRRGLAVMGARSDSLSRFMEAYSRLARLPPPQPRRVEVAEIVRRVAEIETRVKVEVAAGPAASVQADPDQLEQLLINLLRNAAEAALEGRGGVRVGWRRPRGERALELFVEDDGPGLSNTTNLFVPFFTTKPEGSGIGLVLSRQIAEAHGGSLSLANRADASGCRATLRLPL
jgi:PAS domain S-box-containing protein